MRRTTSRKTEPPRRVDCHKCVNFFITWEDQTPYGCRAMGFKSRTIPSLVVFRSSGEPCLQFTPKRRS